jgi:molybdopterin molybdotransferase
MQSTGVLAIHRFPGPAAGNDIIPFETGDGTDDRTSQIIAKQVCQVPQISVETALAVIFEYVRPAKTEQIELASSFGRILAEDGVSDIDLAPFDSSRMDGFAVRSQDFGSMQDDGASVPSVTLDIIGVLGAGSVFAGEVQPGQALRIMCGAPLPAGADAVVKREDAQVLGETDARPAGAQAVLTSKPKAGQNVTRRGRDAERGDIVLQAGDLITAPSMGLLATIGYAKVRVNSRPRVAVLATGSELVAIDKLPGPGKIRCSNTYALAGAAIEAGAVARILPCTKDTPEALAQALASAVISHDAIVISGGAAEGDFDYTAAVIRELGTLLFAKVAMRPGKAQSFGVIEGTPVFGLPGSPGAALIGFEVLVRPALRKMQGFSALERSCCRAALGRDIPRRETSRQYLRAQLRQLADGTLTVAPGDNKPSVVRDAVDKGNCIAVIPEGQAPLHKGDVVNCMML